MVWKPLTRLLSLASSRATRGSNDSSKDGRADVSHGGSNDAPSTVAQGLAASNPKAGSPNVSLQEGLEDDSSDTASTVSVSSKDEIEKTSETFAAPAFRAIPESRNRNGEDVLELEKLYVLSSLRMSKNTKPFTENHDLMDDMLDGVLQVRSFNVYKDTSKNMEAVEQAKSEGVKIRDFAVKSTPQDLTAAPNDQPVVELFLPYEKTLQFFYMRFLINNGVYDLPRYSLTVEDVDRLHTCGMINADDLDNVVLCSMMGHGTYRRLKRSTGSPTYSGAVLPPRGPWTVPVNYCRPSRDEIISYIVSHEQTRFSKYYAINLYRIAAFERPLMTGAYIHHRIQRDGFWGLKRMAGIEDGESIKLFLEKDSTFIAPRTERHQELLSLSLVDAKFQDERPPSSGIQYVPDAGTQGSPSPVPFPALYAADSASPSASAEVVPTTPFRGRSSDSKGKKRARSPSASSERDDINDSRVRRTRPRISDNTTAPPASKNTSPRPMRTLRRSTRRITERLPSHKPPTAAGDVPVSLPTSPTAPSSSSSKGKKRTRDDETEQEDLDESSPTKKVKATGDVMSTAPTYAARPSSKGQKCARGRETEGKGVVESSLTKVKDCGDVAPTGFTYACKPSNPLSETISATLVSPRAAGSSKSPTPESNAVALVPVAVGPSTTSIHRSPMPTPVAPVPASQPSSTSLQTTVTPAPNGAVHMPIVPARTLRRTEIMILPLKTQKSTTAGRSRTAPPHLPDTERGKQWARIDGINIHSWAELCARPKPAPLVAEQQERKDSQVPEVVPEKVKGPRAPVGAVAEGSDAQTQKESSQNEPPAPPPVRRTLTRQHMVYLDEVYPCFHPHHYGTNLVRQPMRYLDEVLPELFPKYVPSEATS